MLNINNLQKKTLKITIPIFLMMVFSFIFIPGVKADGYNNADNIVPFNSDDSGFLNLNLKSEDIEEYISTLNLDSSLDGYIFFVYPVYDRFQFTLFIFSKTIAEDRSLMIRGGNSGAYIGSKIVSYGSTPFTGYYISDSDVIYRSEQKDYKTFNDFVFSKSIDSFTNGNAVYLNSNTNIINKPIYYYSNVNIYNEYTSQNIESSKPKSYTFNEDIVVTDLSKIKVKFKLPSNTSNLAIDFKYKISQLGFGVGTLGDPYVSLKSIENNIEKTSINSFKSYRNRDHLIEEMKNCVSNYYNSIGATHDGSKSFDTLISKLNSISRYDDHKNLEIESAIKSVFVEDDELFVTLYPLALRYVDQDYCSGTYVVSLLPDSTVYEYTFEVDVYNYEGSINLNFTSNLNYEIDYEYKSDLNNFLTTINMDNYSALILIPKVKNLETGSLSSISSDVYLSGIYDINLLEDIDSKNVLYHHNDYDYSVFSHYQDYHYLNATLLFVKKSFGSVNNTITFDSRYYSYVTKFNLSDEVTINNPNTGEDIIIGDISDFYDYGLDNKKFTFNSFLKPIKFVFESITNFYKNYCPELVQNFFYLIFVFFVVLVLIRIFL